MHGGVPDAVPGERAWRLILSAVLWLAAAAVASVLAVAGLRALARLQGGGTLLDGAPDRRLSGTVVLTVAIGAGQAVLLLASVLRGRQLGSGAWRRGVGAGAVGQWALLAGLVLASFLVVPAWLTLLRSLHVPVVSASLAPVFTGPVPSNPAWPVLAAEIAVTAPVLEELTFRGWLWVGLRRRWGAVPVGLVTGGLFLAAHLGDGLAKPLYILPLAALLSVARERCGSVWASVLLHGLNNGGAVALVLALRWAH